MAALLADGIATIAPLFTACSGDSSNKPADGHHTPKLGTVSAVTDTLRLPLDRYRLSDLDRLRIDEGFARLYQSCLLKRWSGGPTDLSWASEYIRPADGVRGVLWGGPFGTMSLEHARRYGYHAGPGEPHALGTGFYEKAVGNVSFEQVSPESTQRRLQRLLDGPVADGGHAEDAEDGCRTVVYKELAVPLHDDMGNAESDAVNLAINHPQVQERMKQWVTCMHKAGEAKYEKVYEAAWSFSLAKLTKREIRVAVKDVKCTQRSRWADYYYAALVDYEQQAIKANPQLFESALRSEQDLYNAIVGK